jgi:hypothetical protein
LKLQGGRHGSIAQFEHPAYATTSRLTVHPPGLPPLQVRIIEDRIEPLTAERLAPFPCSHNSTPADPSQVHRLVTTFRRKQPWHEGFSLKKQTFRDILLI